MLVASDLHLTAPATPTSAAVADQLAGVLAAWEGPGVVVLAGDVVELLSGGVADPAEVLAAYPVLTAVARDFTSARDGRDLVYLIGNHDGRLAWDEAAAAVVAERLGARLALTADLRLETANGTKLVRVEHGHRFDAANAFVDPRDALDTPIGHHIAADCRLAETRTSGGWLAGVAHLNEPGELPRMVASRLLYRVVAPWTWVLALPAVAAWWFAYTWLAVAEGAVVATLVAVAVVVAVSGQRLWTRFTRSLTPRGYAQNDRAREEALALSAQGYAGLVVGHSHHAELAMLGSGFYANVGCCATVVDRRPTRPGLPGVWGAYDQMSWLELEGGADVSARLVYGRTDRRGTRLERLACHRSGPTYASSSERPARRRRDRVVEGVSDRPSRPSVVASLADTAPWPPPPDAVRSVRRARRAGAAAIGTTGVLGILSALSPPVGARLSLLNELLPVSVPPAAAAVVAVLSLALVLLARGVRHGQRPAWRVSIVLLASSALLHVVKGFDFEEAALALATVGYLARHSAAFRARPDRPSVRRGLVALLAGPPLIAAAGTAVLEIVPDGRRMPIGRAFAATAERMMGVTSIDLPSEIGEFLTHTLLAMGIGVAAYALWLAFRPVISGRRPGADIDRARALVRRHGQDTLAYFALRDDKEHFFHGESLVAYAICSGICLVSPDPIGPRHERAQVWAAFRRFVDQNGWTVAVLGATDEWLPIYASGGMRSLYVGDEGVVDVHAFSLAGGQFKGLRQAVNRVAKYGYRIEFHDPSRLDPDLQKALRVCMTKSRKGDVERGFSMTLGRVFDPEDRDLLLAVAFDPQGQPAAFAQFVPAPGIDGYSLDLMRRSDGQHPNGVTDFVVVKTIEHLRERGFRAVGLNFATMRAVMAGELGRGPAQRVQRWVLQRLSSSMQIESLWKYNAKFGPTWQPRYAVYDAPENLVPAALAVAKAESFWELPVIGRFMVPKVTAEPPA